MSLNVQRKGSGMRRTPRLLALAASFVALLAGCSRSGGETDSAPETTQSQNAWALARQGLPAPVLEPLRRSLSAFEEVRELLARDRLEGIDVTASRLASTLGQAESEASGLPPRTQSILEEGAKVADSLSVAKDLKGAREAFGELSRLFLVMANVDPRLLEGWHVFECPMTKTFPKWMQPSSELENPFMGQAMPRCGTPSDLTVTPPSSLSEVEAHIEHAHEGEVAYYTCSMHPSVKSDAPGTCPICSMDLVPVTRQEVETGVIFVDAQRRQTIGVRTAPVKRQPVSVHICAVGKSLYDETRLAEVSVKYKGWIGKLYANATGEPVRKGKPLFTLYSPELYAAQEEFLTALASQRAARATSVPHRADYLVEAARKKLRLWDIQDWQIDRIAESGEPLEYIPIVSPVSGYVIEKNVVEGASVESGRTLYRIAGLDKIWIEAEVYESEIPLIEVGQEAEVTLPYLPGRKFRGRVSFVYPYLEAESRTGRVRIALPNPGLDLRPDMYANVGLSQERGERLVVPEEAVLYVGPRRLVFLDLGEGRLRPQEIEVGVKSGDFYEVLSGLEEGDVVVTSGNFLIAAESRIKSAAKQWQ
ncbi:MAG: efflux RND transporter periplasmic adaptor subunit [Acidobacteriota bacterium]